MELDAVRWVPVRQNHQQQRTFSILISWLCTRVECTCSCPSCGFCTRPSTCTIDSRFRPSAQRTMFCETLPSSSVSTPCRVVTCERKMRKTILDPTHERQWEQCQFLCPHVYVYHGHSPRDRIWCTRARNLTYSPSSASETDIKDLNSGAAMTREPNH